jgi:hypothetical protein
MNGLRVRHGIVVTAMNLILATEEKEQERIKGKVVVLPMLALVAHIIWRVTYFRRFPRTQRRRLSPPWMRA